MGSLPEKSGKTLIVIPAYNEAETIGPVLQSLQTLGSGFDVAVIDDGSADGTAAAVSRHPEVILLRLPFNLGIGGAVQTGLQFAARAGYEAAVQCDADGQHPAESIPALVARLRQGTADVVIGSRYVANSAYKPSFIRRIGKSLLSRWIDLLIGGGITDTTSGFRAFNRKAIALFAEVYPEDYPEPEALVILHMHGLKAAEIPVEMRVRQGGQTSIRPPSAAYYMVKVALAIFIDLFRRYAPIKESSSS